MNKKITIVGGGLAGCEAAWQVAEQGIAVDLYEMKPERFSPAHSLPLLAELVCSNSLRSNAPDTAVGLLKEEMRLLGSLIMRIADQTAVPAGTALAVDRKRFADRVTQALSLHPRISIHRKEVLAIPADSAIHPVILAAGPLASAALTAALQEKTGQAHLAFYDAIAPIVEAESLDRDIVYRKSRWDETGPGDYLNCPLSKEEYLSFVERLLEARTVPLHDFENPRYFEGCLPIEVMCGRGTDTLRFGPMRPIGLSHPVTGHRPWAVVQLRAENAECSMYNLVGFQTKLTYAEQKRVFQSIPGLKEAVFLRFGSVHRNTFVCAPQVLGDDLRLKESAALYIAGQLSGVEGYVESAATGLLAGLNAARQVQGKAIIPPPPATAHGALIQHLIRSDPHYFQPSNVNFGLFPPLEGKFPKKERGRVRSELALGLLRTWQKNLRVFIDR